MEVMLLRIPTEVGKKGWGNDQEGEEERKRQEKEEGEAKEKDKYKIFYDYKSLGKDS